MSLSVQRVTIRGAKPSVGTFGEGAAAVAYDFTELYIDENLDPTTAKGSATVPYKYGTSENFYKYFQPIPANQYPLSAEMDVMTITNGRGSSKSIVTAVRFAKAA